MHSHTDRYARIHARRTLMWITIDGYTCHYISTAYARFAWCAVSSEKSSNSTADRASVWLSRAACSATRAGCSSGDAVQPNARHVAAKREQSIDETERACTVSTSLPISITEKHAFVTTDMEVVSLAIDLLRDIAASCATAAVIALVATWSSSCLPFRFSTQRTCRCTNRANKRPCETCARKGLSDPWDATAQCNCSDTTLRQQLATA